MSQFDVVLSDTCRYNPFLFFFSSDYIKTIVLAMLFTGCFLVLEFHNSTVRSRFTLVFCTEALMLNSINTKNSGFSVFIEGLFGVIFMFNFLGILPFSQTITSQLVFTFLVSSMVMVAI